MFVENIISLVKTGADPREGPWGLGPPLARVHYAYAAMECHVMSKKRRSTAWLNTREGEPPAKHSRQDTENTFQTVILFEC